MDNLRICLPAKNIFFVQPNGDKYYGTPNIINYVTM